MSWLQLEIRAENLEPEAVENALLEAGALSITIGDAGDDPILEPAAGEIPMWDAPRITGLFEADTDMDAVEATLLARLETDRLPPHRIIPLEDRAWEREWLRDFHPMRFGKRLWVAPGGIPGEAEGAVVVELDPGLAFGTGTHPTTALCLEWLDGAILSGRTVVDYGCGSGILSVAAACLGADRVIAVDHDPQALEATKANARRNDVAERIRTFLPDDCPDLTAPVVLANILAGPLVSLAPVLIGHVAAGGRLILSGLLESQTDELIRAYRPAIEFEAPVVRDEWARLAGRRINEGGADSG